MKNNLPATPDSYGLPEVDITLTPEEEACVPAIDAALQTGDIGVIARMMHPEYYQTGNLLRQAAQEATDNRAKLNAPTKTPRVVITVEGGIVQDVTADIPLEVIRIDFDTEGADEEELSTIDDSECYASIWNATVDSQRIDEIERQLPPDESEEASNAAN